MRALIWSSVLLAAPALGQSWGGYVRGWSDSAAVSGTWTGYVGGYQPFTRAPVFPLGTSPVRPPRFTPVPVVVFNAPVEAPRAADEDVAREREAIRAERLEADRRIAEERERLALERQLDAERRRHEAELRAREAEQREQLAAERQAAERAIAAEKERLEREHAEQEARRAALASAPRTPGNDVYRWTDDEGVTHYSTRVPAEMKARARLVGGPSR